MRVSVSVELANGHVAKAQALYPRGHPRNPLSAGERQRKFLALVEPAIGRGRARELDALIDRLDELRDVSDLTRYLTEIR
jgi:2-methylcitrate dehydratase